MTKHFVSEPIEPLSSGTADPHQPSLPAAFRWREETLEVITPLSTRRTTKVDRGDTYLKRHWFEFETADGRIATVYYDRAAKRGQARWWLYSLSS